jgi:heavy metal sensor kinase
MKKHSIGLRLTLCYVAIFAAAQLTFGVGMWLILRHNLYRIVDDTLSGQVEDVQRFFAAQREGASVAKLQEEAGETYVIEHTGDYLQVYDGQGNRIFSSAFVEKNSLSPIPLHDVSAPFFTDFELGGKPFRFLSQRIKVHNRDLILQIGLPVDNILKTLHLFRRYLLMFAPVMLLLASGVGYWLSQRALAPVEALTRTARTISGSNLSGRLEKLHTGDELQRLSDTLNEMLARIEAAFKRITQFTADASHELRTPVSLIWTDAEIALRRSRTEGEYREALRHILCEAERTSSLIETLLSLARADAGREALEIRQLDLRETVEEVAEEWRRAAATRDLEFTATVAKREFHVLADQTSIHRLLCILLDNAVKYTPAPGKIHLRLDACREKAVLTVRDTGIGIAEDDQAHIFERFYRADKARSRAQGGAGLGLAIAGWIVQQHRGAIAVESSLGNGAAFTVEIPLQPVETALAVS